jgi:hypothetical protein
LEPEEGFDPSTFRLRGKGTQSEQAELVKLCLLMSGGKSSWSSPDEGIHSNRMIIEMVKAHSIQRRVPS